MRVHYAIFARPINSTKFTQAKQSSQGRAHIHMLYRTLSRSIAARFVNLNTGAQIESGESRW